jgi:hypothetical protein
MSGEAKAVESGRKKPRVKLVGQDGNAWNLMGLCRNAWKKAGLPEAEWVAIRTEMMSGDYDHLLATACKHFEVR